MSDDLTPKFEATDHVLKKLNESILKPVKKDALDELLDKMMLVNKRVSSRVNPLIETMTDTSRIHRPGDRKELFIFVHKAFVEEFIHLSREELVFMLAYMHAEAVVTGN